MRTSSHSRVKVYFFVMTLSRSRYKFIWFISRPFTDELAVIAHELAFQFFGGIPYTIVYDQDRVFLVSENGGDLILTAAFRAYVRERSFELHFCRKADPESKGKVENVVKYVKQNFLYNRTYCNDETLNEEAMGWLGRTANVLPHGTTKKDPFSEMTIERAHLKAYVPYAIKLPPVTYTVRKDNTISWKSNLYSLPLGTYTGRGCQVAVRKELDTLVISDEQGKMELCRHKIAAGKGGKVTNTDHKRDKSKTIEEFMTDLCKKIDTGAIGLAMYDWLDAIRSEKPRYVRDQLQIIQEVIETKEASIVHRAMIFCHQNNVRNAGDFKAIVEQELRQQTQPVREGKTILLNPLSGIDNKAHIQPEKSSIADYEELLRNKGKSIP